MNEMLITSAQYRTADNEEIVCTIDGAEIFVPLDPSNRHYAEIMRQVAAGDLTIEAAD